MEMRICAEKSWKQSDAQLRTKIPVRLMQKWQDATRSVCAAAYAPYRTGSIYPQLVVGCDDRLNRVLLNEFKQMNDTDLQSSKQPTPNAVPADLLPAALIAQAWQT